MAHFAASLPRRLDQALHPPDQKSPGLHPCEPDLLSQAHTQLQSDKPFPTAIALWLQINSQERQGYSWQNTTFANNTA